MLILLLSIQLQAQRTRYSSIKGAVMDSLSRQPIEAATVSVLLLSDSTVIGYAITGKKGSFFIRDIPQAHSCRLIVSFNGYSPFVKEFTVPADTRDWELNTIWLQKAYTELAEVIVSARRPPIMLRNDTLEFNAGSFRTAPNSVVEALLKKLPGVEVDATGNITVNGKRVSSITVNGREFFGSDFRIASRNLPSDIIDKIQIADFKTAEARFTRAITGSETKVINLVLKKDMDKGVFGRAGAGYGAQHRYEMEANLNYFRGHLQASMIGYANNTNQVGFSGSSLPIPTGGFVGGGGGMTETKAAGLNVSDDFGKKIRINGSYFFTNTQLVNQTTARRLSTLPDTTFYYNVAANNIVDNDDHRANLKLEYALDSFTIIRLDAALKAAVVGNGAENNAVSTSLRGDTLNTAINQLKGHSKDWNVDYLLFMGRRLNKKGRNILLNVESRSSDRKETNNNRVQTEFYKINGVIVGDTLDQQNRVANGSNRFSISCALVEPLTKNLNLEFRYTWSTARGEGNKNTHQLNPLTGQYALLDTAFSNAVLTKSIAHYPYLSVSWGAKKLWATLGTGIQWLEQENVSSDDKERLTQHFMNVFPFANIVYRINPTVKISLGYTGRSQQPGIDQLQTVPDNRNPIYIRLGNPALKPSFFHNGKLEFQQHSSRAHWNMGLQAALVSNQIVYEIWFDSVQYSRPINSNGNYNLTYNLSYSRNWKRGSSGWRFTLGGDGNYNRNVAIAEKRENITHTYGFTQRTTLTWNHKEWITLSPTFTIRYADARFSIGREQGTQNTTKTIALDVMLLWPRRLAWENNIQYSHNTRTAPGFPQGIAMWNMAFNYQLFHQQQGSLRLAVYDLLRQNTSINRHITPTFIEDTKVQVLQRYWLISFIYNLKRFEK